MAQPDDRFIVICKDGDLDGEVRYVLASRQVFPTERAAADYAATIAASREPIIVPGRWWQLRPWDSTRIAEPQPEL